MTDVAPVPAVIDRFRGDWMFLSNFVPCGWILLDGERYATVEHAFQAAKVGYDVTTHHGNPRRRERRWREIIRTAAFPALAKRMGKMVPLRDDWEDVKIAVMRDLLLQKFSLGKQPDYLAGLARTGDAELIEGNTWGDRFWGVDETGVGENHLGKLLMDVRAERRARGEIT